MGSPLTPLHPGQSTHPKALQQMVAGVSRGREGVARLGWGTGVFRIVVTRPVCLSVCRWMRSMWPVTPPPTLKSGLWVKVKKPGWRDSLVSPDQSPRIYMVSLLSNPHTPCTCSGTVLSCEGGMALSKQRAQERTDVWEQHGTMINLWLLTLATFDPFGSLKAF